MSSGRTSRTARGSAARPRVGSGFRTGSTDWFRWLSWLMIPVLKAKVRNAIEYILAHQQADGWLGPVGDSQKHKPYDVWPLFPLFKALVQYQQATGDPRIIPALLGCCRKIDQVISRDPLYSWAKVRAADFAVTLYWLYSQTGEPWVLDLAKKSFAQSQDWRALYENFPYKDKAGEKKEPGKPRGQHGDGPQVRQCSVPAQRRRERQVRNLLDARDSGSVPRATDGDFHV